MSGCAKAMIAHPTIRTRVHIAVADFAGGVWRSGAVVHHEQAF
jgi:hypothetical protein